MRTSIRLASVGDIPGIVGVIRAVYDEYSFTWDPAGYHLDLYELDNFYLSKGFPFWVCESGGEIAGTIALEFFVNLPGPFAELIELDGKARVGGSDCELHRLYVHPDHRRKGIGEALTQTALDFAKEKGCGAMELWSDKRFGDAHRLYGRFGARVVGERICDDPDVSPEWGLIIELN